MVNVLLKIMINVLLKMMVNVLLKVSRKLHESRLL